MRFGGHQTFSIRDGWLFKGLQVLIKTPQLFGTENLRDRLGVGKNMAKSLTHWMKATGLADTKGKGRSATIEASDLGTMVWEYDRYLQYPGTWWIIHSQLVRNANDAYSWNWFFNRFTQNRFERAIALDGLRRQLQADGGRMPSIRTLERDIACLLRSYSEVLPREDVDPEDNLECPLVELGVMSYSRQTGFFRINRGLKPVPFAVFGWLVNQRFASSDEAQVLDISLTELAYEEDSPGRVFALSAEALFDLVKGYEQEEGPRVSISSQAGERVLRIRNQSAESWLEEYFLSLPSEDDLSEEVRVA
jgi:hypothetical protein